MYNKITRLTLFNSQLLLIIILVFMPVSASFSGPNNVHQQFAEQESSSVNLHFFWSLRCPHCLEAKPEIEILDSKYPWLKLHSYDVFGNQANINLYMEMAGQLGMQANSVPGFIFCGQMLVGFSGETTLLQLENSLVACHKKQNVSQQNITLPLLGSMHFQEFSLPVFTFLIAALDAFNPCAFFVLFFLLSLIAHQHNRLRIAAIGGTFVIFSGVMYFLFMAAWLNLFLYTEQLAFITMTAGLIAMLIGIINIKDYFFFNQGISLSIPDTAKPKLFQRIRALTQAGHWPIMLFSASILAITANSYELLCTAGLPMIFTRVLTLNNLSMDQYYLYLVFYNVIYVIPLLFIVIVFTVTMGNRKLSERQGRLLKLLSGLMLLGLGGILFFAPDLLNDITASLSVVGTAIGITLLFALLGYSRHVLKAR